MIMKPRRHLPSFTLLFPLLVFFLFPMSSFTQTLHVMSYNIHHGADRNEVLTIEEIGDFIKKSDVDLVGLQEVDSLCNRSGREDQMKPLAEITGLHSAFLPYFGYAGRAYGLGFISCYQLTDIQNIHT